MTQNKTITIGDIIKVRDEVNRMGLDLPVIGINREKTFMPTVANISEIDTRKYKVVRKGDFVFSGMQTGRDVCIRIGLYTEEQPSLMSPAYTTFVVDESKGVLSEFLFMYFNRFEMDRYGWFISDSSVRSNLDWPRFLEIEIPRVDVNEQRKYIELWKRLCAIKEENEALAAPLFQLCQSKIQNLKHSLKPVEIGQFIEQSDDRNSNGMYTAEDVRGVSIEKRIIDTKANMEGVPVTSYKLFRPSEFCYVPVTSRNGDKITLALNQTASTFIVSGTYEVFRIKNDAAVLPDYLFMWFCRPEFDRLARFNSWGSARESFAFTDMERVHVPIPGIEVQQAIVDIFNCARKAKQIAEEADKLSRDICPALMQKAINT